MSATRRLMRFWVYLAVTVCLVTVAGAAGAVSRTSAAPAIQLEVTPFFSPNGDGMQDRAVVWYSLPRASEEVTLTVLLRHSRVEVRVLHLGAQEAGEHRWTWDGRRDNGKPAPEDQYTVEVTADYPNRSSVSATHRLMLDTHFESGGAYAERYGALRSEPNKVYPRSNEVVDSLPITALAEHFLRRAWLTIRNEAGRTVLRRAFPVGQHDSNGSRLDVAWTGRRNGKPLPVGRYRAVVAGVDKAGNRGQSSQRLRIFVSADRLRWREETRTLTAAETIVNVCTWSTANGCGEPQYCGALASSSQFPGGISHLSAPCPPDSEAYVPQALSSHLVSVPEAVHGIDSTRVAFVGSPTHDGETDPGTLSVGGTTTTSATGAQSPWVEGGNGLVATESTPRLPPSTFWQFYTTGDDAFDVYTFTIDLRYLVVE